MSTSAKLYCWYATSVTICFCLISWLHPKVEREIKAVIATEHPKVGHVYINAWSATKLEDASKNPFSNASDKVVVGFVTIAVPIEIKDGFVLYKSRSVYAIEGADWDDTSSQQGISIQAFNIGFKPIEP